MSEQNSFFSGIFSSDRGQRLGVLLQELESFNFTRDYGARGNFTENEKKVISTIEGLRKLTAEIIGVAQTVQSSGIMLSADTKAIEETSAQVSHAVNEVAEGNAHVADMIQQAAMGVSRTNELIGAINEDLRTVQGTMNDAVRTVKHGDDAVQLQKHAVSETVAKFGEVNGAVDNLKVVAEEIKSIVGAISAISEQTNLLALNAAIEAARAGDAGKGFAVVAQEIRKLSETTKKSTDSVGQLIEKISSEIQYIVKATEKSKTTLETQEKSIQNTEAAFREIHLSVDAIKNEMNSIAGKTESLTENSAELSEAIENISSASEETAAGAEEVAASVQEQSHSIGLINERVKEFNAQTGIITDEMRKFKYVRVAHREWDDAVIQCEVFKEFAKRKLGILVEGIKVNQLGLFKSVADGVADGTLGPWMPNSGAGIMREYGSRLDNLGPNMNGCKLGIMVPKYVTIDSIEEMKTHGKEFGHTIHSIERMASTGAPLLASIEKYGLHDFKPEFGNEKSMLNALESRYGKKEWVAITGWQPYWILGKYDLKFLKDPKKTQFEEEHTATLVRKNMERENPELYKLFKEFRIDVQELNKAVFKVYNGMSHRQAAVELIEKI